MSNQYKYAELREKAIAPEATTEDIENLVDWFESYGMESWNGEYYDVDGYQLWPIHKQINEDEYEIAGWEIR